MYSKVGVSSDIDGFDYGYKDNDVFHATTNNGSSFSLNWTKMVSIERLIEQCWIKPPT